MTWVTLKNASSERYTYLKWSASHLSISSQAASLLVLCILIIWSISLGWTSSSFHFQPLRSIAFQNICCEGYIQFSSLPSPPRGMDDTCRFVGKGNGWPGEGSWFGGGICNNVIYAAIKCPTIITIIIIFTIKYLYPLVYSKTLLLPKLPANSNKTNLSPEFAPIF